MNYEFLHGGNSTVFIFLSFRLYIYVNRNYLLKRAMYEERQGITQDIIKLKMDNKLKFKTSIRTLTAQPLYNAKYSPIFL